MMDVTGLYLKSDLDKSIFDNKKLNLKGTRKARYSEKSELSLYQKLNYFLL